MSCNHFSCVLATTLVVGLLAPAHTFASDSRTLVVAADPNNMPFSNDREEGFENKLASLIAQDLTAELRYVWEPQRRGFFKEMLGVEKCDVVLGAPAGLSGCVTTRPYYRSSYVFVALKSCQLMVQSLDDDSLHGRKIGVQTMGDGQLSPPAYTLIERGLANNLVSFSLYSDDRTENPAAEIIRAVASKKVDVAIAWGPMAGYFAKRSSELVVTPIPQPPAAPEPYSFDICIAVRKDEAPLRDEINSILDRRNKEIGALLDEFGVPRIQENTAADSPHEHAPR